MERRSVLTSIPVLFSGCITTPGTTERPQEGLVIDPVVNTESEDFSVSVNVEESESEGVLAVLHIIVRNVGDDSIGVTSGVPGQFGKLVGYSQEDDTAIVFWSEVYEDSEVSETDDYHLKSWTDLAVTTGIDPGEKLTGKYSIRRDASMGTLTTTIANGVYEIKEYGSDPFEINGEPVNILLNVRDRS